MFGGAQAEGSSGRPISNKRVNELPRTIRRTKSCLLSQRVGLHFVRLDISWRLGREFFNESCGASLFITVLEELIRVMFKILLSCCTKFGIHSQATYAKSCVDFDKWKEF